MSVRAYRINKIEQETNPSFNLWHDTELMDLFEGADGFYNGLNQDGNGTVEIPVSLLETALADLNLNEHTKKALLADVAWAKNKGQEFIMYSCG